jgi:hypothetical protein
MSPTSHIFIVGMPRTGSTLTRSIVNASLEARLGGESQFFDEPTHLGLTRRRGYRSRFRRIGDLRTEDGLRRVVDHIYSLRGKSFWSRMAAQTDRSVFERDLRASDRTDRMLLDVAMAQYARGRPIRGEKTPHHIHHVPTLLDWFPEARVVHTLRDPRAVYASLRHKERPDKLTIGGRLARRLGPAFEAYATANFVRTWRSVAQLHREYLVRYPASYRLLRFEDLVLHPDATTRSLCEFLGIRFTETMLDQVVHNSSFSAKGGGSGIDSSAVDRWRQYLSAGDLSRLDRRLASELHFFGYQR